MLLNATHLLPDASGALICQKHRLVAVSDPIGPDSPPTAVGDALRALAALARTRRPQLIVWLGNALAGRLAAGQVSPREAQDMRHLCDQHRWCWVGDELPDGLPGESHSRLKIGGLTFCQTGQPSMTIGEIAAQPSPYAPLDGQAWPAYVIDGRKLLLPLFGPQAGRHTVLTPPVQSLFRRPFQALLLMNGQIVTRQRGQLDQPDRPTAATAPAAPRSTPTGGPRRAVISPITYPDPVPSHADAPPGPLRGTRMQLFSSSDE